MKITSILLLSLLAGCNSPNQPSGQYAPPVPSPNVRLGITVGGKHGFIDESGKLAINPQWDAAYPFTEGLAMVCVGECDGEHLVGFRLTKDFKKITLEQSFKYGYIDELGKLVINPSYEDARNFSEGLAAVCEGKGCYSFSAKTDQPRKWGYIDKSGAIVITPQFDAANDFKEGFASVSVGGKWGYIGNRGNFAINPQFDGAGDFEKGFATIRAEVHDTENTTISKFGYIDKTGKVIWQPSN